MATINITIPDPVAGRVLDAFALVYGYDPGSGQTKAQFAKGQVISFMKSTVKQAEQRQLIDNNSSDVDNNVGIS